MTRHKDNTISKQLCYIIVTFQYGIQITYLVSKIMILSDMQVIKKRFSKGQKRKKAILP
ncbi:hypothetical protein HMPREF0880_04797, partial [Yokenella regensburgei ATCC 43003]